MRADRGRLGREFNGGASLLGAIIAKAAGAIEIASLRGDERLKHQTDLVFLLSIAARRSPRTMHADIEPRDRQRLHKALAPIVANDEHRGWARANRLDVRSVYERLTA